MRSEKDHFKNRKSDMNQFEYEGDFRQQKNFKPLEEKKNPAISNFYFLKFLEKNTIARQIKVVPSIPKVSAIDYFWDLIFSY